MKVISPSAYVALREALSTIVWHKRAFETYVRAALGNCPELLTRIDFSATKRETSDEIIKLLTEDPVKYHDVTIELMLNVASIDRFTDIETLSDRENRELRLTAAKASVAALRDHTQGFALQRERQEKRATAREARAREAAELRRFADDLSKLRARYLQLHQLGNPRERGRQFEGLLSNLFELYDLEPRLSYVLPHEQIDGSIRYDTDHYILEAKWTKDRTEVKDLRVFDNKVQDKGRNALGIFISVKGFTSGALEKFSERTSFIAVDGEELFFILDGRVRLDDMLRNKKRHANETGSCMLPTREWLTGGS